ncbi:MAG TPA: beta-ketoacyl-[acyl-carrier-protein] synthase family protein [Polyangiaceae bacterium]|jgi:3-oxoacyl-[acyl-carrier-protein] synthase II|nr:MAG: 3-oxoacyl-(acyl-carrier-protein) synthase 2 [Deltaproteobacteria bacterium ADurb.Bin207]HNS96692.1 beta-ketoacyl-[acyl-carrier-protein] synthase family protein [Polyangiaceae bacterium]HNZ24309.1 beta-ketoacyl-[acyl-carrier-protein] synthase family protein [Polyangiaceae bacterium]HOD25382.1 beta-ketoacyl-[acyl-carrier-protein] synthase family protein [Polyangiaceae bacterium]HOE49657.1 beta-ketoacyl-[acyl-carrier-protein] synthase family protein [Polyangiaceae bacterium]
MKRVVVTGIGLITPVGLDAQTSFASLAAGKSGISRLETYDPSGEKVLVGGEVKPSDVERMAEELPQEVRERSSRFVYFAMKAGREALAAAGNVHKDPNVAERFGVVTGVGYGAPMPSEGYKVGPSTIIKAMPNAAAAWMAIVEGVRGPNMSCSTACASGAHAIGIAFDQIRLGRAIGMLAGGVDTVVTRDVMRSFAWLRAVNTAKDEEPSKMSRPFDKTRRGFVLGEGAGFLVLEEREHAMARGATIIAEMRGWGASSDAHHIVAVEPEGKGMARAMRLALSDSHIAPEEMDYISAHGTSTPMNDRLETLAIRDVFGKHANDLLVSSQKSMIGHAMGGAGAIEAVVTVLTLAHGVATPTINLQTPDPDCDLDYVPHEARKKPIRAAMSNSFGFGGHDSAIIFAQPNGL